MRGRNFSPMLIFAIMGFAALSLGGQSPAHALEGAIKIGSVISLTGGASVYGNQVKQGIELAIDKINKEGGVDGAKMEAIIEDGAGERAQAAALMRKFAADPSILCVVGPIRSPVMLAISPIADQLKIPLVAPSGSLKMDFNKWTFRNSLLDDVASPAALDFARKKWGLKKAVILYARDDDFSMVGMKVFEKACQDQGITLLDKLSFMSKDTDFSAQLTKIKSLNSDAILIPILDQNAALVISQARQLGLEQPFVGSMSVGSPRLFELSGGAAVGTVAVTGFFAESDRPVVQDFVKRFRERFNMDPPTFAGYVTDVIGMIADACKRANTTTDRAKFRDALGATTNYVGVSGVLTFRDKGDAEKQPIVIQLGSDGKWHQAK